MFEISCLRGKTGSEPPFPHVTRRRCKLANLQTCKLANLQTCKLANLQMQAGVAVKNGVWESEYNQGP